MLHFLTPLSPAYCPKQRRCINYLRISKHLLCSIKSEEYEWRFGRTLKATAFIILANFHDCFYNSCRNKEKFFFFPLRNHHVKKKGKSLVYFDYKNVLLIVVVVQMCYKAFSNEQFIRQHMENKTDFLKTWPLKQIS